MPKRQRQTSGDITGSSNLTTKTWFDESSSSDSDGSADSKESVDSKDYKKAAYRRWGIDSPQHFMGAFESESDSDSDESDSDSDESDSDSDEEPEEEEPSFLHITNEQLIARQQRQDQLRIAKMGAFHPSWHHPLDPSKGKRGTSSSTEQGNALSYLVIRAENTESPVPTVKKITGEFVARIPDHCFEELRAEASAESGWRRDPAHMGYGLPMRKFDASDLEKEEKKNNRPIQMLYYKDEEKKGYNVYFSGWTCQTTLFNKGKAFQRLEVFPRAQLRTMFIMKLFGNRVDKMQVEAAQDPDHLFWLLEDMSHIHTMANKGYGDGFVYYMTTDSKMPRLPIYKYTPIAIVTDKTYEHCARSRFSKSFETLKRDSKKQWETRMGGICENPRGCVCENRYEMLFGGDGGVHQLRYQEDASGNSVLNFKDHKVEKAAMIVECSDACGCSRNCPRRCVQKRTAFKLVVLYLSPDVGNGLFSAIPIAAGSFIIEYVGLCRMVDEAEGDGQSYKASASNILPEVIIDSLTIGNVSRFVNYSSSPNAFLLQVFSRTSEEEVLVPRIAIFAAQDIEYGEQITIPWPKSQTPAEDKDHKDKNHKDHKDKDQSGLMKINTRKPDENVCGSLFEPVQVSAQHDVEIPLDETEVWCNLSETRFAMLICMFKPIGKERAFRMLTIVDKMNRIFLDDPALAEIFVKEEDVERYRQLKAAVDAGDKTVDMNISFEPSYSLRVFPEELSEKLSTWFQVDKCEFNETENDAEENIDPDPNAGPSQPPMKTRRRRVLSPEE